MKRFNRSRRGGLLRRVGLLVGVLALALPAGTSSLTPSSPAAQKVSVILISPTEERPAETDRPTFEWKVEPAIEGLTYTLVVRELALAEEEVEEKDVDPEGWRVFFERTGIRETVFRYPPEFPPLDPDKVYAWQVTAIRDGMELGRSRLEVFPVAVVPIPIIFCQLVCQPCTYQICVGSTPLLKAKARMFGAGISGPYSWTLTDPNGPTLSGQIPPAPGPWWTWTWVTVSPTPPPAPGVYSYTLTVTRGICVRSVTFTVYVYPVLTAEVLDYPSGVPITELCWGEDATLRMKDVPSGCTVTWEYRDLPSPTWISFGTGNPFNTNLIQPTCPPGQAFVTRQFRGTVSCGHLPPPWPWACPASRVVSLKVWCPTQAGTVSVSPGTAICSHNTYPVPVTLSVTGHVGAILGWTVNGAPIAGSAGMTSISYPITSAGTYTFCVRVKNGTCEERQACATVKVEDPISAQITTTATELCWGDDATLTLIHNGPPGTQIQWQYQVNCSGSWTTTGVTGTAQNTNEVFGPSYPGVTPPTTHPCLPDRICWRAIVTPPAGICPPTTAGPVTIRVIVPPTPPSIVPAGPIVKCPGQPVSLSAQPPTCGTPPFTYQWYHNGLPFATGQTISPTSPGHYFVVVFNKDKCHFAQSANTVTVRDCVTTVSIQGPCTCAPGTTITLTAVPHSYVVPAGPTPPGCGGPYTYKWSTGATTPSITIPCPAQTTTLWVEVTNAMGCKAKVYHTIKVCP